MSPQSTTVPQPNVTLAAAGEPHAELRPRPQRAINAERMRGITAEGQRPIAIDVLRMQDIGTETRSVEV
jgi:hypothetical protein